MIDRRFTLKALLMMAAGCLAGAARAAADPAAEQLQNALSRLQVKADAEDSTPVFLAGENLARDDLAGYTPDTLNRQLAAAYRDYAALLPGLERDATEYDAALLVVVLAERDFLAGRQ
jgi:hypothetical protein